MKRILDACCGSKMFWFDKNNPDVEFCDIRTLERTEYYPGRYIEINPDTVCDFTNLPFENNSFHLVVFDPPLGRALMVTVKNHLCGGKRELRYPVTYMERYYEHGYSFYMNGTEILLPDYSEVIAWKPLPEPWEEE